MIDTLVAVCMGLGLAAACGFRVFLPVAVLSVASKAGLVNLGEGFAWLGSWPAVIALCTACVVEIAGYYIPWVDHALDTLATPAAAVAGALVTASQLVPGDIDPQTGAQISSVSPMLKWLGSILAGGGVAGLVQISTVLTRSLSTLTTLGTGNSVVATGENIAAVLLTVLAIVVPVLAVTLLLAVIFVVIRRRRRKAAECPAVGVPACAMS